jgi:hypothetical protein
VTTSSDGDWCDTDKIEIFGSATPFVIFIDILKESCTCDYTLRD